VLAACVICSGGCVGLPNWGPFKKTPAPPGPVDDLVLRDGKLETDPGVAAQQASKTAAELGGAKELFRRGEYVQAQKVFHRIANDTKNTTQVAEEATYYEGESLRLQGKYPKAGDTYSKLLKDFPSGQFRDQANQRLFDIANYWLDDTRGEMEAYREKKEGKRWLVMPASYVHWDKTKPMLDEEGWAVEKLEEIQVDIRSPLADKALFYLGGVKFFRKDYIEADRHFSQLTQMLPNSPLAPQALKMAIICKQLSTGGSDYDGRKAAEARALIDKAFAAYPELKNKEHEFLVAQLYSITQQQADKDYNIAEFYRRTGHPGSAYFYYEIVRRRYPGTPYFDKATKRMHELKAVLEKAQKQAPPQPTIPLPKFLQKSPAPAPKNAPQQQLPPPRPLAPGAPLLREQEAPAPRALPADMIGNRQ
jgi:outer membrane protein assembly factor BamD (BamD/ComL family)